MTILKTERNGRSSIIVSIPDHCLHFYIKIEKNRYPGIQNKFNQVELISNNSGNEIHILGLSKTKLKDFHPDSYFNIENYKLFRKDRILQGKEESEKEGLLCM